MARRRRNSQPRGVAGIGRESATKYGDLRDSFACISNCEALRYRHSSTRFGGDALAEIEFCLGDGDGGLQLIVLEADLLDELLEHGSCLIVQRLVDGLERQRHEGVDRFVIGARGLLVDGIDERHGGRDVAMMLLPKQYSVSVGRNAAFLARIVSVGADVEAIRGQEGRREVRESEPRRVRMLDFLRELVLLEKSLDVAARAEGNGGFVRKIDAVVEISEDDELVAIFREDRVQLARIGLPRGKNLLQRFELSCWEIREGSGMFQAGWISRDLHLGRGRAVGELSADVLVLKHRGGNLEIHAGENVGDVFVSLRHGVLMRSEMAVKETEVGPLATNPDADRALVGDGSQRTGRDGADGDFTNSALQTGATAAYDEHQTDELPRTNEEIGFLR